MREITPKDSDMDETHFCNLLVSPEAGIVEGSHSVFVHCVDVSLAREKLLKGKKVWRGVNGSIRVGEGNRRRKVWKEEVN